MYDAYAPASTLPHHSGAFGAGKSGGQPHEGRKQPVADAMWARAVRARTSVAQRAAGASPWNFTSAAGPFLLSRQLYAKLLRPTCATQGSPWFALYAPKGKRRHGVASHAVSPSESMMNLRSEADSSTSFFDLLR